MSIVQSWNVQHISDHVQRAGLIGLNYRDSIICCSKILENPSGKFNFSMPLGFGACPGTPCSPSWGGDFKKLKKIPMLPSHLEPMLDACCSCLICGSTFISDKCLLWCCRSCRSYRICWLQCWLFPAHGRILQPVQGKTALSQSILARTASESGPSSLKQIPIKFDLVELELRHQNTKNYQCNRQLHLVHVGMWLVVIIYSYTGV